VSQLLDQRRRLLLKYGRTLQLERLMSDKSRPSINVLAKFYAYSPEQVSQNANISPGDAKIEITNDELSTAGWSGPSSQTDTFIMDGKRYTVKGSSAPLMAGAVHCGFSVMVKG
jgi:hypothetical protein